MSKGAEYVFLTRGEIHIHDDKNLTIHLKPRDGRLKDITTLMSKKNIRGPRWGNELKIVTIDPKKTGHCNTFYAGNWYLISALEYTGHADYSGFRHYSFSYTCDSEYVWEKKGVRLLTSNEVEKFRRTLKLF